MATLSIVEIGDPILRQVAKEIVFGDTRPVDLDQLILAMHETLEASGGVGLAAPQVGVGLRIIIVKQMGGPTVTLVNPEIVDLGESHQLIAINEGCLSVPGATQRVTRRSRITVHFNDPLSDYERFEMQFEDIEAIIVQHEIDHLNGILITDYEVPKS